MRETTRYSLIPLSSANYVYTRFDIVFSDGSVRQYQYINLHAVQFSADGCEMSFVISGSSTIIHFKGDNLQGLRDDMRGCRISVFHAYYTDTFSEPLIDGEPVIYEVEELGRKT